MGAAGLDEDHDLFAPVFQSARRRAFWLGVNLLTAFVAASVVDLFQTTIDKVVLLAVLMPIVPSMGGVAGTQSLTIITRAIALGQIEGSNAIYVLRREFLVGVINGLFWALLDPALAGGVILTTITDVVGYGLFLGLGAVFLL